MKAAVRNSVRQVLPVLWPLLIIFVLGFLSIGQGSSVDNELADHKIERFSSAELALSAAPGEPASKGAAQRQR